MCLFEMIDLADMLDRHVAQGERAEVARAIKQLAASGLPENAFDLFDGNPIDLRHLGNRHAVLYPGSDARELRHRDLRRLVGADGRFNRRAAYGRGR
jgi:hypothetical protein